ncbi:MAG TPA: TIGR02302 family protein [Paracoccaceae bacterium]|nr:TIGR02302 family protein [Paracoccaceae bacterium]
MDRNAAPTGLRRTIARTRLALALERFVAAFWPVWTIAFLTAALIRLDLLGLLSPTPRLALLGLLALGFLWYLVRGLRRFRWPARGEAVRRIDDALPGRPVSALSDHQAIGLDDAAARGVWAAHMRRVAAMAEAARAARANLRLAAQDRYALRYGALALLVAAAIFGRGTVGGQVDAALSPPATASVEAGPALEAWASPPAYTGRPTLYLTAQEAGQTLTVPEGTVITLRIYGEGAPALTESVSAEGAALLGDTGTGLRQAEFKAERAGTVTVRDGSLMLGAWSFDVIPDAPPTVELVEPPQRTATGAGQFTYRGQDDYGLTAAWATAVLNRERLDRRHGLAPEPEPREAIEFDLPLPLSGAAQDFTEKEIIDLSLHPWAGLPITITLHARDAAGQEVSSEPYDVVLPGRRFYEPVARALVEQRRDLLWTLANARRTGRLLKAVTYEPEELFESHKAYLVTRTAIRRLDYAIEGERVAEARDSVTDLLWRAALLIEDGDLGSALERLRRAQERLSKALDSDATEEEIAELMDELREAMQNYLQELMRQALENPDQLQQDQNQAEMQPNMDMQDLQDMLDRLQELMQNGQRAEAQELLEQLRRMMENMQMALRPGQQQPGQGQQMLEGLQDLMRQQQGLGDDTFRELQRQLGQGDQPGEQQGPGTGELSRRQEALRQLLDQFRQGMPPGLGQAQPGDPAESARRSLEEAERNMGDARDSLRQGDSGKAVDEQAEALDNLREGMRSLSDAMRQAQQQPGTDGTFARDRPGEPRDPLGRPMGPSGQIDSNDVQIPGTEAYKRSREIQEEIRRRAGEQNRPKLELDYLKRLLERF